jgi:hypothetical protein
LNALGDVIITAITGVRFTSGLTARRAHVFPTASPSTEGDRGRGSTDRPGFRDVGCRAGGG